MKRKITVIALICALSIPSFGQNIDLGNVQDVIDDFSVGLAGTLPFTSAIGLNWSDAHVGNFPNLGVGVALGATSMALPGNVSIGSILGAFNVSNPLDNLPFKVKSGMLLPAYVIEARVGGFVLPFDVGVKFGIIPDLGTYTNGKISLDYLLLGANIRYAILKNDFILPTLSVGLGFNYLKGGIGTSIGSTQTVDLPNSGGSITIDQPKVGLEWETKSIDATVQLSKSLLIITPYLGFGANYAFSKAGYAVKATVSGLDAAEKDALEKIGIDIDDAGFSSIQGQKGLSYRLFGGISLNLALLRFDITAMYSLGNNLKNVSTTLDNNFGLTFGIRLQI
ncbi:MAG: hypothetical protein LBQ77_04585 [Treponema sp.]|jgi:hypothetical protein|nr:hypothetical protein [Treponema sp.]